MSRVRKWLQARVKKVAGLSVKQVRGSLTSPRRMAVTSVIIIAVIAAIDILAGLLHSGADLLSFLLSGVIGDALVHLELHQNWYAMGGALLISLIGILAAVRGVRAVHRYGRLDLEPQESTGQALAPSVNGAPTSDTQVR
ncbi:MAG TPA: hypothetical protein VF221_12330 [Chloroflexota bacterium]